MGFNIKQYLAGGEASLKVKSTTDGSNGEVPHHHVDSSALPTGAATADRQDTGNASLAAIDGKLGGTLSVAVTSGGGGDASAANQATANAALGAPADAEATGNGTIVAVLKRIRTLLGNIGAGAASGSLRVTVATDDGLHAKLGEVQASPTANTVLDRLKSIATALAGLLGVTPQMASGGNIAAQTNNPGSTYAAFGSQACKQVTVVNDTGTTILVQQGAAGVGVPIFDQSAFTFFGIANANVLGVKRKDEGNTQVTVAARWEA